MPDDVQLSPAGQLRREQILRRAQLESRRRRHRRQALRAAVLVAILALAAPLILRQKAALRHPIAVAPSQARSPSENVVAQPEQPTYFTKKPLVIAFITTEPHLADRLAVKPSRRTWHELNDDQLLQQLSDAGHPAGLAWIGGHEMLLFRNPLVTASRVQSRQQ